MLKGQIHAASGDHRQALGDFQKAAGIDASRDDVQLQIVQSYRSLGDPLRALSAIETLLEKYPADQQPNQALVEKSSALLQLNQHSAAIETLKLAIRNDPTPEMFHALANAQELSGRNTTALQTLDEAKQRFPGDYLVAERTGGTASNHQIR